MDYGLIVEMYEKIESTTKRLEITDYLVEFFQNTDKSLIDKVVYLTLGKLYPDYVGVEFGIAEKMAIKAISRATGISEEKVEEELNKTGDLGLTSANLLGRRKQSTLIIFEETAGSYLSVEEVYEVLEKIAHALGAGSQEQKISYLAGLLTKAKPKEAKYIVRTVTGKLRIGLADMTILDALAIAFCGSKEERPKLERAYNLSSDLGSVAKAVSEDCRKGLENFKITVGKPIRPMLAERLTSSEEILEKLGGIGAAEYKYDGERIQAHKFGSEVLLFSRRLENITSHYPDVRELLQSSLKAKEAIVEAECVAINPETGELLPFQELMHRRRKYEIEEAMKLYPVSIFLFDVLFVNGEDLTLRSYRERRRALESIVSISERVKVSKSVEVSDGEELERFFEEAIENGCEGVIVKSVKPESVYQAGARGWMWIKYKRDYRSVLTDTLDLVVIGAFHGMGKRAGSFGALLMAAYDKGNDVFRSVCKVGSGFTDEDLALLPKLLKPYKIPHRHGRVESRMEADVWFSPQLVLEIVGSEITLSPIHTCGKDVIRKGSGLAVRFPRFTGKYRKDKAPEDATTVDEVMRMYREQLKKVQEAPVPEA